MQQYETTTKASDLSSSELQIVTANEQGTKVSLQYKPQKKEKSKSLINTNYVKS